MLILNAGGVLSIVVIVSVFILFPARSVTKPFSLYVTSNVVLSGIEKSARYTAKYSPSSPPVAFVTSD